MIARIAFVSLLALVTAPAMAATCEATVEGNDAMQFNVKEIVVDKSCSDFTITLEHTGTMPKSAMGHNIVVSKKSDEQAIAIDGASAGLENSYIKPDDERVIAYSEVIGGGESTSITFDVAKLEAGEDYTYFCSFPGHWAVMTGSLVLSE